MGRLGAGVGAGTRGLPQPVRTAAGGCVPPVRSARESVQLVGLPADGLSPQHGPAHRPYPAVAAAGRSLHRLRDRQGATQVGTAVRPYAGDCHPGLILAGLSALPALSATVTRY